MVHDDEIKYPAVCMNQRNVSTKLLCITSRGTMICLWSKNKFERAVVSKQSTCFKLIYTQCESEGITCGCIPYLALFLGMLSPMNPSTNHQSILIILPQAAVG
jgi:hypothetical protein